MVRPTTTQQADNRHTDTSQRTVSSLLLQHLRHPLQPLQPLRLRQRGGGRAGSRPRAEQGYYHHRHRRRRHAQAPHGPSPAGRRSSRREGSLTPKSHSRASQSSGGRYSLVNTHSLTNYSPSTTLSIARTAVPKPRLEVNVAASLLLLVFLSDKCRVSRGVDVSPCTPQDGGLCTLTRRALHAKVTNIYIGVSWMFLKWNIRLFRPWAHM